MHQVKVTLKVAWTQIVAGLARRKIAGKWKTDGKNQVWKGLDQKVKRWK